MDNNDVYVLKELDKYVSLTEYLQSQGHQIRYVVLQQDIIEANRWISKKLQIPLASKVFSFKKLRIVDDAVSYTHLDVYKRQVPAKPLCSICLPGFMNPVKEPFF